jgi:hypothetical protein
MKIETYIKKIQALHACEEAVEAAGKYTTSQELWDDCKRGDWMLWLIAGTRRQGCRKLVLAACECARLSLQYIPDGDDRPKIAIETAERWARGKDGVTLDMVREAAYAANAAANAAAYAAYAANAANAAACAAYAAANAAAYAAFAAKAAYSAIDAYAAYTAYSAGADAALFAKNKILEKCADVVRQYYPKVDVLFRKEQEGKNGLLSSLRSE